MVYVVILNWNGWRDTVECLESLLRLADHDVRIVVCDNASTDESLLRIQEWAGGTEPCPQPSERFSGLFESPLTKPVPTTVWVPGEAVSGDDEARVILVPTGANLGFAGGCNVGLRYVLARADAEFIWLLNNDTVVPSDSLRHLRDTMHRRPDVGLCGSTLRFYDEPEKVQCYGGYDFNTWTARVKPVGTKFTGEALPNETKIEQELKYINGASTFLRPEFLWTVGLMNEQYFLYFEEIDWATRAKGDFALGYCSKSTVYHKEGMSIGSDRSQEKRSLFSERYLSRNRALFMRTYYPVRLPVTMLWIGLVIVYRLLRGRFGLAKMVWLSAWSGILTRPQAVPSLTR